MNSRTIVLFTFLVMSLSCSHEKIVELPLTTHADYGPFSMGFSGVRVYSSDDNNPWKNAFPKISKFPEGLTDMKHGYIETNICQSVYQDYLLGNITKDLYELSLNSLNLDTLNLSKTPVKTKIAFACGKDSQGIFKLVVDANNNLDLSDDNLFTPIKVNALDRAKEDSLAQVYAVKVSLETYIHNKIVPVSVRLFTYSFNNDLFMYNFLQHSTTQFKGEQIAVCSGYSSDFSFNDLQVALLKDLKNGEKLKRESIYNKNEYIEIKDEVYKILGVNTNKNVLIIKKTDQIFSTQIGYKSYPFQGEEFTTGSTISLENLKGKYVLLDFWAEWCSPCIKEFPALKELYAKTDRAKFEIIGIIGASSFNGTKELIGKHELTWPQILSDKIVNNYGITGYPSTFIIDTEGTIIAKDLRGEELEAKILSLVNE